MQARKAIGSVVLLLVTASVFAGGITAEQARYSARSNPASALFDNDTAETPSWAVGNFWTYDMNITYEAQGAEVGMSMDEVRFEVTSENDEAYFLDFQGDVAGSVNVASIIQGTFQNTDITGTVEVRKSDLAFVRIYNVSMTGAIQRQFVTTSFYLDIELKQNVTPAVSPFDFPIELFEEWTVPVTTFWLYVEGEVALAIPYPIYYDFPVYIEEHDMVCMGKEVVTVPAGRFSDAFHVRGVEAPYDFYYAPTASNVVKTVYDGVRLWYNESLYWDLSEFVVALVDTNYQPPNEPPYVPSDPQPANRSTDVPTDAELSWVGGDPDGDEVTYDVYFGATSPPPLVTANHTSTVYDPGMLDAVTTHFWRIVAWDEGGRTAAGPEWIFATGEQANAPPEPPAISGPTSGEAGTVYNYSFIATDPEGDNVSYWIEWGADCPAVRWDGPHVSGVPVTFNNSWDVRGTYTIRAKARDVHGAESAWGTLEVSMPKTYRNWWLFDLLSGILQRLRVAWMLLPAGL
jgi:hypothetical protein